jgi:hypothetical protein
MSVFALLEMAACFAVFARSIAVLRWTHSTSDLKSGEHLVSAADLL